MPSWLIFAFLSVLFLRKSDIRLVVGTPESSREALLGCPLCAQVSFSLWGVGAVVLSQYQS